MAAAGAAAAFLGPPLAFSASILSKLALTLAKVSAGPVGISFSLSKLVTSFHLAATSSGVKGKSNNPPSLLYYLNFPMYPPATSKRDPFSSHYSEAK